MLTNGNILPLNNLLKNNEIFLLTSVFIYV